MIEHWFVYIAECRDKKLYVGIAKDVSKRINQHNKGLACRFTKFRYPVRLLYEEKCLDYQSARMRELEIKGFSREKKLTIIRSVERSFSG